MISARQEPRPTEVVPVSISILAGGLSTRMGRDKARLRLGQRTLLGHARAVAGELDLPVRVIRRDLVPRCGPLGGIFTALQTSRTDIELFLACDMPFVTAPLLRRLLRTLGRRRAAFVAADGLAGFPFALRVECLPVVRREIDRQRYSLQSLALALRARLLPCLGKNRLQLLNLNTPADLKRLPRRKS